MTGGEYGRSIAGWMGALALLFAGCAADTAETAAPDVARIEGELEVFVVSDSAQLIHELRDGAGRRLRLEFDRQPPRLATGDRVRVQGALLDDDRFAVHEIELQDDDGEDGVAVTAQPLIGNAVARTSRLAVLMVHWSSPSELTPEQMNERVFTGERSTAAFYRENSYGLFDLTGDVFGWYQISAISSCDTQTLASRARAAATAAGVDIASYDQVLYYYPRTTGCQFSGLAQLGRPTRPARDTWYNGSAGCVVLAQELLHNFGALHSHSWSCTGVIGGSCQDSEYGDPFDPMGGGCYHTNVYQKAAQGWLGRCNVVTTTADETFKIVPTEIPSNAVQAVRVPMDASLCPGELSSCYYYLEYRQPIGPFDGAEGAQAESRVHDGVLLHAAGAVDFTGAGRPGEPYLLDTTPGSGQREDFADAVLALGETFEDPSGVSISVYALESDGATVTIRFPGGGSGAPTCIDGSGGSMGPPPAQGMCDDGEFEFESRCYAPTDTAATYDAAAALCAGRGAGWQLADVGSAAENAFVARVVGTGEFWLGGNDRTTEGAWAWDGSGTQFWSGGATGAAEPGVYTNFEPGEPNDGNGNSDCLRMITGGAWRDIDCAQEYPAVCESE
jgi:hypothetical protein